MMQDNTPPVITIQSTSPEDTAGLAQRLAPALRAGDILALEGDLGAGKTHFARSLIQALMAQYGAIEDVPSPSFTLVQEYTVGELEIWHCDLYRLSDPDEVIELGLLDAFETALCLIEWPARMASDLPGHAIWFRFQADAEDPDLRRISLGSRANSARVAELAELIDSSTQGTK